MTRSFRSPGSKNASGINLEGRSTTILLSCCRPRICRRFTRRTAAFTCSPARTWKQGATAWEAAGTIHTDIQKGFIRAEVISFADFLAAGGETQAKRAGKQRLEQKQYVVQDYDLMNFRFNK